MKYKYMKAQEYCVRVADGTHDSPKAKPSSNFLITSKHISEFMLSKETANTISDEDFMKINSRSYVSQFDVLISMIGTVGRTYLVLEEKIDYAIKNLGLFSTEGNLNKSLWLYYYLQSPMAKNYINQNMRGSTQQYLPLNALRNFPIMVLEDEESMNHITKILFNMDNKIQNNIRIIKLLEEYSSLLFKNFFIDFEFPDEKGNPYKSSGGEMVESELGMVPVGWKVNTIKLFANKIKSGGTPSRKNQAYWADADIPWIRTQEIKNNFIISSEEFISEEGLKNSAAKMVEKNAILVAMYGATAGKLALLKFNATTNQACCAIETKHYSYLYNYFISIQKQIENLSTGSAQQNLSKQVIENIKIIIPDENILARYEETAVSVIELIENLCRKNQKLAQLRDTLLPKLFSGEIEVQPKIESTIS